LGIEIRADAGFAVPALYDYCEKEGIDYAIGLITNPRLVELAEPLLEQARRRHEAEGLKAKLLAECSYRAESWQRYRRVVYKAEAMEEGTNTRFVVTNKGERPERLYRWYVGRGETENRIKDFKLALKADRLSCRRFLGQPVQAHRACGGLLAVGRAQEEVDEGGRKADAIGHFAALVDQDRWQGEGVAHQGACTLRVHLASGHPGQRLWQALAAGRMAPS
jgi:hypothetical protein